jgi:glucose/mannose transport system permease protein
MTSLKTQTSFARSIPFVPPGPNGFTFGHYQLAWDALSGAMVNSFLFVIPAAVFSAFLGSLTAFGLTNTKWRYQIPILMTFIAGIFIPYQAVIVPLSRLWTIVNLENLLAPIVGLPVVEPYHISLLELLITHTAYGIPITMLLFRGYYQTLSTEMLEAAKLDGATLFTTYRRIVLPLSGPIFAVAIIYQFTQVWNDFLFALIIAGGGEGAPATVALNNLKGGIITSYTNQMAGAFIVALPTLIVYVLFGRQFAEGISQQN